MEIQFITLRWRRPVTVYSTSETMVFPLTEPGQTMEIHTTKKRTGRKKEIKEVETKLEQFEEKYILCHYRMEV